MKYIVLLIFLTGIPDYGKGQEQQSLCDKFSNEVNFTPQRLTSQDSVENKKYFDKLQKLYTEAGYPFNGDPYSIAFNHLIKTIDTSEYLKLVTLFCTEKEKFNEITGIDYYLALYLIKSNAVIKGTVIYKDDYSDSCLFYKTTYFVKVDSVITSRFSLQKNDTLIIKSSRSGYAGGCNPENKKSNFSLNAVKNYNKGDKSILFIDRGLYLDRYEMLIKNHYQYFDDYCSNAFIIQLSNAKLSELLLNSDRDRLKSFLLKINR